MISATAAAAKAKLRQEIKQRLASMSSEERLKQSEIVTRKVLESQEYKRSQRVCLYLNMPEEVSTMDILKDVLASGKSCFVPRYTKTEMEMLRLHSLEDYESLPLTKWNIRQPEKSEDREEALSSGGLDLILVPGLAFTPDGTRLGRGKGYYDTYLQKCDMATPKAPPTTIGLAFKEQILDYIPTADHDRRIGQILYPNLTS